MAHKALRAAEMIPGPSHTHDSNFPADALLAPRVRSGDSLLPIPALKEATVNDFEIFQ